MIVVVQENTPSDALRGMSVFGGSLAGCLGAAVPVVTVSGHNYKNVFFVVFCLILCRIFVRFCSFWSRFEPVARVVCCMLEHGELTMTCCS